MDDDEEEQSGGKVIKIGEAPGKKKLERSLESRSLLQHPRFILRSGLLIFQHSDGFLTLIPPSGSLGKIGTPYRGSPPPPHHLRF